MKEIREGVWSVHVYSRREGSLHILTFAGVRQGLKPLVPVAGEAQQVDDLEQVRGHHGDAQVEQAVAETDRALQPVHSLGADPVQAPRGRRRSRLVLVRLVEGRDRGGGGGRGWGDRKSTRLNSSHL